MIDRLNQTFGIPKALTFEENEYEFIKAVLRHQSGSSTEVYLYGAHITSWRTPKDGEILYLSPKALFEEGKAIRGGMPIIFPQFGNGPIVTHGFARTRLWSIQSTKLGEAGEVHLTLKLQPAHGELVEIWPRQFVAEFEVILSDTLVTKFRVTNADSRPLDFQIAFHTYFQIRNIKKTALSGFQGYQYIDKLRDSARAVEKRKVLTFDGEVDRIYTGTKTTTLIDPVVLRKIIIEKRNMKDSVVWNPWTEKTATMSDMNPNGFQNMICVESGNIAQPIQLDVQQSFECSQTLSVIPLTERHPSEFADFS